MSDGQTPDHQQLPLSLGVLSLMGRLRQDCLPREQESGGGKDVDLKGQGERRGQGPRLELQEWRGKETQIEGKGQETRNGLRCVE